MKISNQTLAILKNFASINNGIVVKKGNVLRVTDKKNILAVATVEEKFPVDFAIYDLNMFLNVVSAYKEPPEFEFHSANVDIALNTDRPVRYFYANPKTIVTSDATIEMKDVGVSFKLLNDDLQDLLKMAHIMVRPEIVIYGNAETISILATDTKDESPNEYAIHLKTKTTKNFRFVFDTETIKVLPLDYEVTISPIGITKFSHGDVLEYVLCSIAKTSTYEGKSVTHKEEK